MKAIGIIPARYHSTRFVGKPLADICGKPMIEHVYERALKSESLASLVVATDDERILRTVEGFGGKAILTSSHHQSGTDRIAEALSKIQVEDNDVIVNIQGDQPLLKPEMVDAVIRPLMTDLSLVMGTLCCRIKAEAELSNPNVVKVVVDKNGFALYFSRFPIPYVREQNTATYHYRHIGIYVYRKEFLLRFSRMPQSELEKAEILEQLRALENGYRIKLVETDMDSVEVDTPEDLEKVKKVMRGGG